MFREKSIDQSTSLADAPPDILLVIRDFNSDPEINRRLQSMGLHLNDNLIKLNNSKWGPILLQNVTNQANKLALGRDLADKILVAY